MLSYTSRRLIPDLPSLPASHKIFHLFYQWDLLNRPHSRTRRLHTPSSPPRDPIQRIQREDFFQQKKKKPNQKKKNPNPNPNSNPPRSNVKGSALEALLKVPSLGESKITQDHDPAPIRKLASTPPLKIIWCHDPPPVRQFDPYPVSKVPPPWAKLTRSNPRKDEKPSRPDTFGTTVRLTPWQKKLDTSVPLRFHVSKTDLVSSELRDSIASKLKLVPPANSSKREDRRPGEKKASVGSTSNGLEVETDKISAQQEKGDVVKFYSSTRVRFHMARAPIRHHLGRGDIDPLGEERINTRSEKMDQPMLTAKESSVLFSPPLAFPSLQKGNEKERQRGWSRNDGELQNAEGRRGAANNDLEPPL